MILHLTFRGDPPVARAPGRPFEEERGPIAELLSHGYAYAVLRYTEAQPDGPGTFGSGIAALAVPPPAERPPDGWGTIGIWSWVASRVADALSADPRLDGGRIALVGHSRLGKTALWAGASDHRFAVIFSSCAGEMGSSLARRDFGETVDDMARRFPWQFAPAFRRFVGRWNDLPVDTHFLISLCAPRPVLITGGSDDLWADPKGEFLAEVAAAPVYRLLGRRGPSTETMPQMDQAVVEGDLAFRYHRGGHAILPGDWTTFLAFADRYLQPSQP